ncbi:DNA-binding MarR family transcriptional regulator [Mycolicibacterium moriokaense]|uniref:DNA-binding MarR family transcriptional regulator n=2 Tax=Mycolicibacterium moriokaense TaxID=39691 RepID=A0A318HES5_9MYCO|nr:DNA-binding MarR family transcriptional regulator [Mycolicibacterium moriokaense]
MLQVNRNLCDLKRQLIYPRDMTRRTRWLTDAEQAAWMELVRVLFTLPAALDMQLRRDCDLTQYEYLALGVLAEQPSRTMGMKSLATMTNGSLSRLSHVVKRLEAADYVRRETNSDDGRLTDAILTDAGFAKVAAAAPGHVATVRALVFDHLTGEQVAQLADILGRVCVTDS